MTVRVGLVLLLAVLLAACTTAPAPPPPAPTPPPGPTALSVGVDELPAGFNPHLLAHRSSVTTALAALVLPSVFRPDSSGVPQLDPTIATSASVVSAEPFTVNYELNVAAAWSSNAPIAAEDFVYLWERMRSEPGVADAAGYRLITDVRSRAGGKAVDVVFSQAYPQWRSLFTDLLPAHILKDAPGSWTGALAGGLPASGGPFRIASVDRDRGEIVLSRNDLYWDTPAVLDTLVLRRLDPAATAAALVSGDVDVALPEATPALLTALTGLTPPPHRQSAPQATVTQLAMRTDGGPLSDPRARRGVAALLDREAVRAAVAPEAQLADAFGLGPGESGYASTAPADRPVAPDPVAAATLLAGAGWNRDLVTGRWAFDGTRVDLVLGAASERRQDQLVARAIAAQLEAAGIDVTLIAPPAVDLFDSPTVPATPPSPSPSPSGSRSGSPSPTPTSTPATATTSTTASGTPLPPGTTRPDLVVAPRAIGQDRGTALASGFGCPAASVLVPAPPRAPTGFCFAALEPLFAELLSDLSSDPGRPAAAADAVEAALWAQLPALPLFRPATAVLSTPAGDAATGVTPGPLLTGPLTGAERWRAPSG